MPSIGDLCNCCTEKAQEKRRSVAEQKTCKQKSITPYGAWESPITAEFITTSGVGIGSPACSADGTLHWVEGRPEESGRNVICRMASPQEKASDRGGVDVTRRETNVRTLVHEYGGRGHLLVDLPEGGVIHCNFQDQRLYWTQSDGSMVNLLPATAYEKDGQYRFADFVLDEKRKKLICVREDHSAGGGVDSIVNTICTVALDGTGAMDVLVKGCDFYGAPRLSPDGTKLAYYCWVHPNMTWDATELLVVTLDEAGAIIGEPTSICGGHQANISVLQPAWSPQSVLHFVSDQSGWYNLYKHDEANGVMNLTPYSREYSGDHPGWMLGQINYCFVGESCIAITYKRTDNGASCLVLLDPSGAREFGQEFLPEHIGGVSASPDGKQLYFVGGEPSAPSGIYRWYIPPSPAKQEQVLPAVKIVSTMNTGVQLDKEFISIPQLKSFQTPIGGNETCYAFFYAPVNPNFEAPAGAKPPLLVRAHGGPTACTTTNFNPALQFWTSRGWAVLDVDYRGSTGYGREYCQRLKNGFGITDVEDVCAGAKFLVDEGLVNPKHLAIDGGSSGGYTTLCSLTFKNTFSAGCSLFGIGDLKTLASGSNKLESHYMDSLIGQYPKEQLEAIFAERSPVKHLDKLNCPILLLHGKEDKAVPPEQSVTMYEAAKAKGIPCALKMYDGEQHGFRKAENIKDSLQTEMQFFAKVFGFEAAGMPDVVVTNL